MYDAAGRPGRPRGRKAVREGLTDRQMRVVEAIREHTHRHGYPPSMRQIGEATGLASTSSVAYQLTKLEHMGVVGRDPRRPRAYRVLGPDPLFEDTGEAAEPS